MNSYNDRLKKTVRMVFVLLTGASLLTVVSCTGGGEPPKTSGSTDLNGLWRVKNTTQQSVATVNIRNSATVADNGGTINMVYCVERNNETLSRTGNRLAPFMDGSIDVNNGDSMRSQGASLGTVEFEKMSLAPNFAMGSFAMESNEVANVTTNDVCTSTTSAVLVGVPGYESVSATVPYQGSMLKIEMSRLLGFFAGSFSFGGETLTTAVELESPAFKPVYKTDRIMLHNGTLTITSRSNIHITGRFSGETPKGGNISADFDFQLP